MSKDSLVNGEFCWNELMTNDTNKAKEFYGALLGWEAHSLDMDGMTYTVFKSSDKDICGMMQIPKEHANEIPPHWMSYIYTSNLEAAIEKATELGATIRVPITKAGEYGGFVVLVNPTGAQIAFWQPTK